MGLDIPDLDDRRFEDLMEDARKRIPVHSDEWTDHNAHDPGITILELLAWLAESYGYQLDQVTEAHRLKYLDLVGTTPRPPQPATGRLSLGVVAGPDSTAPRTETPDAASAADEDVEAVEQARSRPTVDGEELPAGTPVAAKLPTDDAEPFETTEDVTLTVASVADVVSEHPAGRTDHTRENADDGRHYRAFGAEAGPGCALYLGFDADPFVGEVLDLLVDYHEENLPAPASDADPVGNEGDVSGTEPDVYFSPSIEVGWQYCTDPENWYEERAWTDLDVAVDETMHFYRGGRVRLERPDGWAREDEREPVQILGRETPRHWLRCVTRGHAAEDERYEVPPQLDAVRTNVVRVAHRESVDEAELTRRDGVETSADPGQRFEFPADRPVARAETVRVGDEPWTEVENFDASGPSEYHYVLDRADGEVRFGDGRHGSIPEPGQGVVARGVVYGGGPGGNVSTEAAWQVTDDDFRTLDAAPLEPIAGGREAETIDEAFARAIDGRRVAHRAVTADDYRDLAMRTPGLRVARAAALVGEGDGPVRVVVVPYSPPTTARPVPTSGFLDAVGDFLDERVLLTEQVRAVPPTYVPVDVTAEVHLGGDARAEAERAAAERDIEAFLDPLEGYDGDGWPFGRPVYESELYEVLEARDAIDSVRDVQVHTGGDVALGDAEGALPYPDDVTVLVRRDGVRRGGGR